MSHKFNTLYDVDKKLLLRHIEALGLHTVDDYVDWCATNGFTRKLIKTGRERSDELSALKKSVAVGVLRSHVNNKISSKVLESDFTDKTASFSNKTLNLIKDICTDGKYKDTSSFVSFLREIFKKSEELVSSDFVENRSTHGLTYLRVLQNLVSYRVFWIREVNSWEPKSHNRDRNLSSLLRHLLSKYHVPVFLDSAWTTQLTDKAASTYQSWFIEIGQGASVRTLSGLPYLFTKKQAHYFLQAPSSFTVPDSIIYGYIVGSGGDERLVEAILGSPIGRMGLAPIPEFWTPLVSMFISNPMLDRNQFQQIYDYVTNQRFVGSPPPQPGFSWKGRTPDTLLRQTEEWHNRLSKQRSKNFLEWSPVAISWFQKEEGIVYRQSYKVWTIEEITNSKELSQEGTAQRNCVGSYARSCVSGGTSIWSMKLKTMSDTQERVMTIEVNNLTRSIVQARGFANSSPEQKPYAILCEWAAKAGLSVSTYRSRFI